MFGAWKCNFTNTLIYNFIIFDEWHGQEDEEEKEEEEEKAVIGFWSAFSWLVGLTLIIALLSEYVVGTIEVPNYTLSISYCLHMILCYK